MSEERLANLRVTYMTLDGLAEEYENDAGVVARVEGVKELVHRSIEDEQT